MVRQSLHPPCSLYIACPVFPLRVSSAGSISPCSINQESCAISRHLEEESVGQVFQDPIWDSICIMYQAKLYHIVSFCSHCSFYMAEPQWGVEDSLQKEVPNWTYGSVVGTAPLCAATLDNADRSVTFQPFSLCWELCGQILENHSSLDGMSLQVWSFRWLCLLFVPAKAACLQL